MNMHTKIHGFAGHDPRPEAANDGLRPISEVIRPIVADLSVGQPHPSVTYWADGEVIRTANGRVLTVEQARQAIVGWQELSIDTIKGRAGHSPQIAADLVAENMRCIGQLLTAIAAVEGSDPTPPASIARAA